MSPDVELDEDPARLDVALLHRWLSEQAYWAKGRSLATVQAAVEGSWCVGAYDARGQVGFARLVTDRATHAWLCDVFVDERTRGEGVGRALVQRCLDATDGWGVTRTMLATRDAHALYRSFGFVELEDGRFLERGLPDQPSVRR